MISTYNKYQISMALGQKIGFLNNIEMIFLLKNFNALDHSSATGKLKSHNLQRLARQAWNKLIKYTFVVENPYKT